MKLKHKKSSQTILSDRIADALTVKPRADIEDDQVFGTKPRTLTRADLGSSESEDEAAISDFRRRNVNLLSDISKKYEGEVVSHRKDDSDRYEDSNSDDEQNCLTAKDLSLFDESEDSNDDSTSNKPSEMEELHKVKSVENAKPKTTTFESDSNVSDSPKVLSNSKFKKMHDQDIEYDSEVKSEDDIQLNEQIENSNEARTLEITSETGDLQKLKSFFERNTKLKTTTESDSDVSDDSESPKISPHFKLKKISTQDSENDSEVESENYDIMQCKKQIEKSDTDNDDEESENDDEDDVGDGYDISQIDEPMKEDFEHVKKQNVSEEAKKGACVRNQLLLWEGLLEMRIHLQRCINTANQMPLPDKHNDLKKNNEFSEECNTTKTNIATVLDKFLTLQNMLLKHYPETKSISSDKKVTEESKSDVKLDSDEEIHSDTDNDEIPSDTDGEADNPSVKETKSQTKPPSKKRKLQDYEFEICNSHKAFKTFRDSTIQKWNDKTRLATATNIKNKNAPSNTVLQQISYILSDKVKLIKRTQLKRSEYNIVGHKKEVDEPKSEQNGTDAPKTKDRKDDDEYITEIFDDSDFYHQLLRELIECKSADISDPVQLSRQWIALQQMRSKMKRKVDTKATKGRKIKYVVHNPLVNYMAPEKSTTWTDESTNELYSSLFGKMFEHNNIGLNANVENGFKIKD